MYGIAVARSLRGRSALPLGSGAAQAVSGSLGGEETNTCLVSSG